MKSKLIEFRKNLLSSTYDIALITETWLSDNSNNAELGLQGFSTYRCDRDFNQCSKKDGGGVAIFVRESIFSKQIHPVSSIENAEQSFVMIKANSKKIILGCTYLPGYCTKESYDAHCRSVQELAETHPD